MLSIGSLLSDFKDLLTGYQRVPCVPVLVDGNPGGQRPVAPGVYVYEGDDCTGRCHRLDGYCADVERAVGYRVRSAWVVNRGDFWDTTSPSILAKPTWRSRRGPEQAPFAPGDRPRAADKLPD
jgi:hypothetical protein